MSVPISKETDATCKAIFATLSKETVALSARRIRLKLNLPSKDEQKVCLAIKHMVNVGKLERWHEPGRYYMYWLPGALAAPPKANGKHAPAQTELNFQQAVNQQPKTEQDHKAAERSILKALADIEGGRSSVEKAMAETKDIAKIVGSIIVPKRHIKLLLDAVLDSKESFSPELSALILELTDKVS